MAVVIICEVSLASPGAKTTYESFLCTLDNTVMQIAAYTKPKAKPAIVGRHHIIFIGSVVAGRMFYSSMQCRVV